MQYSCKRLSKNPHDTMGKAMITAKHHNMLFLFLLLLAVSFLVEQGYSQTTYPVSYGPPYYNSSKYPAYGGRPSNTVSGAIDNWWDAYRDFWGSSARNCTYHLILYENGETTGLYAYMGLRGGCTGSDRILGTPYCPPGSTLQGSLCIGQEVRSKNLGPPPNRCE
jgi:hypothetical protein